MARVGDAGRPDGLLRDEPEDSALVVRRQAFFLRKALGQAEAAEPGRNTIEGLPASALLMALTSKNWPVRQAALRILEEGTGKSFGTLTKSSDETAVNTVAGAWPPG